MNMSLSVIRDAAASNIIKFHVEATPGAPGEVIKWYEIIRGTNNGSSTESLPFTLEQNGKTARVDSGGIAGTYGAFAGVEDANGVQIGTALAMARWRA